MSRKSTPICLEHASHGFQPNKDIILAKKEEMELSLPSSPEETVRIKGDVVLTLQPKPRLRVHFNSESSYFDSYNNGEIIKVSLDNMKLHCFATSISTSDMRNYKVTLSSSNDRSTTSTVENLLYADFYVINFPSSFGNGVKGRKNPNFLWRSRLEFGDKNWQIVLDKMEEYKSIEEELKKTDGFAITYAGRIERSSGDFFCSEDLSRIVNKLNLFLSFASGSDTPTCFLRGYNHEGEMIWQDWSLPKVARWTLSQDNWFSDQNSQDQFQELFTGWSQLLDDEQWESELPKILYWYTYAGRNTEGAGTDGSLILGIAALELITYNYLAEMYKQNDVQNNIYRTLKDLDIPVSIPRRLTSLYEYSMKKNWQTGPKTIVQLRNEIVHPDRESSPGSFVCYEGLQLALWYIEMIILRLCDYQGVYENRLVQMKWSGDAESVPWMKE